MSSISRHHAEWLSLLEISGPFLSIPVLMRVFPQGLDAHDSQHHAELRAAYEEWLDDQGGLHPDPAIHTAWIRYVLENTLEYVPEVLASGQAIPDGISATFPEHGETLRPDYALLDPQDHTPRLLIQTYPAQQGIERAVAGSRWKTSPASRMMELLHATNINLGLVTNGEHWMLVHAPRGETTGYISWYADLWGEERLTLRAFRSLLGVQRFFGVPEDETLQAMIADSAQQQHEVTDQLGRQVRRAVEILVQAIDRADVDRDRTLLTGIDESTLYEAALTVMMRLVFLLSAEERGLLLLGDPIYDQNYAISTLLDQQRDLASAHGEDVLERRHDAWSRLLATFRVVYGGIQHDRLRLPAYGSSLFDPDRYPFLEGRQPDTHWRDSCAQPLPIHNRTVLHLLEALQYLLVNVPRSSAREARRLSFRALDIEQIGHVYEGLLDHEAVRAEDNDPVLGFRGAGSKEPEIPLSVLEAQPDFDTLAKFLKDTTGRSINAIRNDLQREPDPDRTTRLRAACGNSEALYQRALPYLDLLRDDDNQNPVVILPGSLYVTEGLTRRQTGTHYTPRSLTEPIVQHTLEPLVYHGPAEGLAREDWQLRPAADLLDLKVCDMAMGSGAFLVQTCRYLSERLVEAWEAACEGGVQITPEGQPSRGEAGESLIPTDTEERLALARRLVADRCLYGVDKQYLAVEMAKLSLWLITMDRGRAFTFLDHALKCGDSLIGVSPEQLRYWRLDTGDMTQQAVFAYTFEAQREEIINLRRQISQMPVNTIDDQRDKAHLLDDADKLTHNLRAASDALVWSYFNDLPRADQERFREAMLHAHRDGKSVPDEWEAVPTLRDQKLKPFHWELEFPEVFLDERGGFDAFMGNPPFKSGRLIGSELGNTYRDYIAIHKQGKKGSADLCAYFFLRGISLLAKKRTLGMIATNSITDTDTRVVGLEQILATGNSIYVGHNDLSWPGKASVDISLVQIYTSDWKSTCLLDGNETNFISSNLDTLPEENPYPLRAMNDRNSQGISVMGEGFVLTFEEKEHLLTLDGNNADVIFGYFNGADLNNLPEISPRRWIINFGDMSLAEANLYTAPFARAENLVKPFREGLTGQIHEECFWKFWDKRPRLQAYMRSHNWALGSAVVTKYVSFQFVPLSNNIYNHKVKLFFFDQWHDFAILQSSLHDQWARWRSGTLGSTTVNYSVSEALDTFPFALDLSLLSSIGEKYHEHRRQVMLARQEGLTDTYNRFHASDETAEDIDHLRALHVEMDRAVAAAYGWDDLALGHGFHETAQGVRFTISEAARREVLTRLLRLNHTRYEEEVAAGLHEKKAGKSRKRGKPKRAEETKPDNGGQLSMF